jgi:hypothetical protein
MKCSIFIFNNLKIKKFNSTKRFGKTNSDDEIFQVLGAYGFRGLIQRKQHFIASLEKGIENITVFAKSWKNMKNYPELKK